MKPCRTKGSTKTESAAGRGGLSAPSESRIILLVVRVSSLFLRPEEEATYTACVDRVSPSYSLSSLSLPRSLRQAFHNRKKRDFQLSLLMNAVTVGLKRFFLTLLSIQFVPVTLPLLEQ